MPDSIADWVVRNTSPSKEELMKESKNIFSPTRNSTANIDKWKQDSPVERIRIIEEYCQEALDLLGLKKMLHNKQQLQLNGFENDTDFRGEK